MTYSYSDRKIGSTVQVAETPKPKGKTAESTARGPVREHVRTLLAEHGRRRLRRRALPPGADDVRERRDDDGVLVLGAQRGAPPDTAASCRRRRRLWLAVAGRWQRRRSPVVATGALVSGRSSGAGALSGAIHASVSACAVPARARARQRPYVLFTRARLFC
jgi:hypothetical protein